MNIDQFAHAVEVISSPVEWFGIPLDFAGDLFFASVIVLALIGIIGLTAKTLVVKLTSVAAVGCFAVAFAAFLTLPISQTLTEDQRIAYAELNTVITKYDAPDEIKAFSIVNLRGLAKDKLRELRKLEQSLSMLGIETSKDLDVMALAALTGTTLEAP